MSKKSKHRIAAIRRAASQPRPICANPLCGRPRSHDSESGLCHYCCRQPNDPTPDEIAVKAQTIKLQTLLEMAAND